MNDEIKISGTVETCQPLETYPSGFSKRVLVINTGGKYPQTIPVEFHKDKAELLTGLSKGQDVTASVNLRGNEYNGKYYVNLSCWKLSGGSGGGGRNTEYSQESSGGNEPSPEDLRKTDDFDDDIPF